MIYWTACLSYLFVSFSLYLSLVSVSCLARSLYLSLCLASSTMFISGLGILIILHSFFYFLFLFSVHVCVFFVFSGVVYLYAL